jgi:beta-aspartyl-dipeptidase (metallo-type)
VRYFFDHGGDAERLTASSDASITSPQGLFDQVRQCVSELRMPLERVLPIVTSNTARVLKLANKGSIAIGSDADLLVLRKDSLELDAVISQGKVLFQHGRLAIHEAWLADSDRRFAVHGEKDAIGKT